MTKLEKPSNNRRKKYKGRGVAQKIPVMTLISRTGEARTFPIPNTKRGTLQAIMIPNIDGEAIIMTDKFSSYRETEKHFLGHGVVDHSKEYVRGVIHTNFAESYHSLLKRGIVGSYHHVSKKHLPRYLREFEFRWNHRRETNFDRAAKTIRGARGKRLFYQKPTKSN